MARGQRIPTTNGILRLVDEIIQLHKTILHRRQFALICALSLSLVFRRQTVVLLGPYLFNRGVLVHNKFVIVRSVVELFIDKVYPPLGDIVHLSFLKSVVELVSDLVETSSTNFRGLVDERDVKVRSLAIFPAFKF